MEKKRAVFPLACAVIAVFFQFFICMAQTDKKVFELMLVLTPQDESMDWWYAVPANFGPKICGVTEVSRGEHFTILPIFNNHGITAANEVDITYDLEVLKPDGTVYNSKKSLKGYKGAVHGVYLLPAREMTLLFFDPEDPFGEYTVNVAARDHVTHQTATGSQKITLKEFHIEAFTEDWNEWFFSYSTRPAPSTALSAFLDTRHPYQDSKQHLVWSALWFYKCIFEKNEFLLPHAAEFFKAGATEKQQKDILLLFHLLNKTGLPTAPKKLTAYVKGLKKIEIPNPYVEITSGDQLDMLWSEFFATGRVKPIRQLLTAFNHSIHAGTLEKIKSGELKKSAENINNAVFDAVFRSAAWSLKSNCTRSPLLFQYCVGLYEGNMLNDVEKECLGEILTEFSGDRKAPAQPDAADGI